MGEVVSFEKVKNNHPKVEEPKPIGEWTVDDWRFYFYFMADEFGEDEAWDLMYERILELAGEIV